MTQWRVIAARIAANEELDSSLLSTHACRTRRRLLASISGSRRARSSVAPRNTVCVSAYLVCPVCIDGPDRKLRRVQFAVTAPRDPGFENAECGVCIASPRTLAAIAATAGGARTNRTASGCSDGKDCRHGDGADAQ